MRTVGAYELKTHLARIIADVEAGQTVTVTRHGRPVARITPVTDDLTSRQEAVDALLAFGREHRGALKGLAIRELIDERRKY